MVKLFFVCIVLVNTALSAVTPSDVYAQVNQIVKEVHTIKKHLGINKKALYFELKTQLKPRHAWQKTYEIMVKINILRSTHKLPIIQPTAMEPVLNVDPMLTFEQTQRILQELRLLKFRLGITQTITPAKSYQGKTPMDVFNLLNLVSHELDIINGNEFTPSYVFAEAMRIYDEINIILHALGIDDTTFPPFKGQNLKPRNAFNTAIKLLEQIKHLHSRVGIETIDFYVFRKEDINPGDVFGITEMILAELQVLKAYLGLRHELTPQAKYYENKTPSDVEQVLGWSLRKLYLIKSLTLKGAN